jgi:succinate dehydrogenase hydrophobic anchor subunit
MTTGKQRAGAEFWRMMRWIGLAAVLMVAGALTYLAFSVGLTLHMVIATVAGVFLSTLLGCGLFALAFFSDKSGHDDDVSNSTTRQSESEP